MLFYPIFVAAYPGTTTRSVDFLSAVSNNHFLSFLNFLHFDGIQHYTQQTADA